MLIAEDDPVTAKIVVHRVSREPGLAVVLVSDGGAALAAAEAHDLSAAILDIKLPVMDGLTVLSRLRAQPTYAELPILLLTSLGTEADIVRGFELGADDYVIKPFSPAELMARLKRLLEHSEGTPSA